MRLKDLLSSEPVQVVAADANIVEAARQMLEHDVGLLPVVEGDRLVGVVTDRDIVLRCIAQGNLGEMSPVSDVMSVEVICGFDDQTVDEAKKLILENGVQRLLVTDRQNKLVGVLSMAALEGKPYPRRKPVKVTFYKDKTDSHGGHHKVSLRTVYVSGKGSEEEAKTAASKVVEEERKRPLSQIANGVDAEKMPGKR